MTDQDIDRACHQHGAKTVSDAAYAAMEGRPQALAAMGLSPTNLGETYRITVVAYRLMSADEQAADLTRAVIDGSKLP